MYLFISSTPQTEGVSVKVGTLTHDGHHDDSSNHSLEL
jgi:hypothetical protein